MRSLLLTGIILFLLQGCSVLSTRNNGYGPRFGKGHHRKNTQASIYVRESPMQEISTSVSYLEHYADTPRRDSIHSQVRRTDTLLKPGQDNGNIDSLASHQPAQRPVRASQAEGDSGPVSGTGYAGNVGVVMWLIVLAGVLVLFLTILAESVSTFILVCSIICASLAFMMWVISALVGEPDYTGTYKLLGLFFIFLMIVMMFIGLLGSDNL